MIIKLLGKKVGIAGSVDSLEAEIHETADFILSLIENQDVENLGLGRMINLRNRVNALYNYITQFGESATVSMNEMQQKIMKIHPRLVELSNLISWRSKKFTALITSASSYLLSLLCASASASPKSMIIGVSQVLAQVLVDDVGVQTLPIIKHEPNTSKFYDEFIIYFNYILTSACLYSTPIANLPGISLIELGDWSIKAIKQFDFLHSYITKYYRPELFISAEKNSEDRFRMIKGILNFFFVENYYLVEFGSRADLLTGFEFLKISENSDGSKDYEEVTQFICNRIIKNCGKIEESISILENLAKKGQMDRNDALELKKEAKIILNKVEGWKSIAELGKLTFAIFNEEEIKPSINLSDDLHDYPYFSTSDPVHLNLMNLLDKMLYILNNMENNEDTKFKNFINTTGFSEYRFFFKHILYIIAINDQKLKKTSLIEWFFYKNKIMFEDTVIEFTSFETLIFANLLVFDGVQNDEDKKVILGKNLLDKVATYFEFQSHHSISIRILQEIAEIKLSKKSYQSNCKKLEEIIKKFIEEFEISFNSMLYQKLNVYLTILDQLQNKDKQIEYFADLIQHRFIPFDIFSWINLPRNSTGGCLWIPVNSSVETLNF